MVSSPQPSEACDNSGSLGSKAPRRGLERDAEHWGPGLGGVAAEASQGPELKVLMWGKVLLVFREGEFTYPSPTTGGRVALSLLPRLPGVWLCDGCLCLCCRAWTSHWGFPG